MNIEPSKLDQSLLAAYLDAYTVSGELSGTISNATLSDTAIRATVVGGDVTGNVGNMALDTTPGSEPVITGTIFAGAVTLAKLNVDATNYIDGKGQLLARLVLTANTNFTKATYPTMTRVNVIAVGGGGGGGNAGNTTSGPSEESMGSFGGAGAYAERSIPVGTLPASVPVVVGGGGSALNFGGISSFGIGAGYQVRANGGEGANTMSGGINPTSTAGGIGGTTSAAYGEIVSAGESGENGTRVENPNGNGFVIPQGTSGGGPWGGSARAPNTTGNGIAGQGYGAGGGPGRNIAADAPEGQKTGGAGHACVVIIEVYS